MAVVPEELLQFICENLRPTGDLKNRDEDDDKASTLRNVSHANRAFRRIAQPIMMHSLDFRKRSWSSLQSVLHLIVEQPYRAEHVRKISVPAWQARLDDEDIPCRPTPTQRHAFLKAVDGLVISSELQSEIKGSLARGLQDAELALLLCLCTKIECIDFDVPSGFYDSYVKHVVTEFTEPAAKDAASMPFQCISDVQLDDDSAKGSTDLSDIAFFFRLPALRKLSSQMLNFVDRHQFPSMRTPVRTIELTCPLLGPNGVGDMLSVCPDVTSLTFDWGNCMVNFKCSWTIFGDVLREFGQKLEYLSISLEDCQIFRDPLGGLGSLAPLFQLKSLTVPFFGLHDIGRSLDQQSDLKDMLPTSLSSLRMWIDEDINKLAENVGCVDAQLDGLLHDARFEALSTIQFNHVPSLRFMFRTHSEWDESGSKDGWITIEKSAFGTLVDTWPTASVDNNHGE